MSGDPLKADLIRWLEAEMARATGRSYRIDLGALDVGSLRELQRLLRDVQADRNAAVQRARVEGWRG